VPDGHLNLWNGFAIEAREGKWPSIEWFLLNIACAGDKGVYDRLVKAIAWKLQNPTLAPEVAIVMLGPQGTGKGTFAHMFASTFGRAHYLQITDETQVTTTHNPYLLGRFVMFFDEVFFGHNPKVKGKIKGMITEPTLLINPKWVNPFPVRNGLLCLYASNETAALPIDIDSRRDTVLRFSTQKKDDKAYFIKLRKAMNEGEMSAFLHACQQMDLADYEDERRKPILTAARNELALITSNPAHDFLFKLLEGDSLPGFIQPNDKVNDKKEKSTAWLNDDIWVDWDLLHGDYRDFVEKQHRAKTPMSGRELRTVFRTVLMTYDDAVVRLKSTTVYVRSIKDNKRLHLFPSRPIARVRWENYTKSKVDWPDDIDATDVPF
jgi:hypothetical protein